MPCDIHLHVEVKIDNQWHHYTLCRLKRNYQLFARMADVRNNWGITPITPPKGLPDDPTFLTQFDASRWGTDGHSHSWLSSKEVEELETWFNEQEEKWGDSLSEQCGWLFGNSFQGFHKYPEDKPEGLEDFRWVFWFDN
jgi:hypothetical protein